MEMGARYTKQCKVHGKVGECTQKEEREKGVHGSVGRAPKKRNLERECGGSHKPCSHQETPYKVSMPCGDDQNFQHLLFSSIWKDQNPCDEEVCPR